MRLAAEADAPAIVEFFLANREHLAATDPVRPADFHTREYWQKQALTNLQELQQDRAARFFVFAREEPERVIGHANFNNIIRGVFQSCFLGFSISASHQGKGLMFEAVGTAIAYAFGPLGLHRISANYMPHNVRSGRLLRRLGFTAEGYARDYLRIAGRWEDHVLTSLLNPQWREPQLR